MVAEDVSEARYPLAGSQRVTAQACVAGAEAVEFEDLRVAVLPHPGRAWQRGEVAEMVAQFAAKP